MGRKKRTVKRLGTIWEVPDELWARIEPILLEDASLPEPSQGGRKRTDWRAAFNGIMFRMRSGCPWNQLPQRFGSDSSVHRWFQRWCRSGVMEKVWAVMVSECDELGGVQWEWQSADGAMGKARFGGDKIGPNPTDRGKNGTKRRIVVDQDGGPLGAAIAGANVPDTKLLEATLTAIVVERPEPSEDAPQNLCLDKGSDNPTGHRTVPAYNYEPHIPAIGEEKAVKRGKTHKPKRWVVERTHAWLSQCRGILVRYDKNSFNYLGLIPLACGLLWYRRLHRMGAASRVLG